MSTYLQSIKDDEIVLKQDSIFINSEEVTIKEAFEIGQKLLELANELFNYALDVRDLK